MRLRRLRHPHADGEAGTIVIWLLGLCVMLLFLGGLSVDLWRVLGERRALAGIADSASIAGATAIDEDAFRDQGLVLLDPTLAGERARAVLADHVAGGRSSLTAADALAETDRILVIVEGRVPLTLLRILLPLDDPVIHLEVRAVAAPQRG